METTTAEHTRRRHQHSIETTTLRIKHMNRKNDDWKPEEALSQELAEKLHLTDGEEKTESGKDDIYYEQRPPRVPVYLPQFYIIHDRYDERDIVYSAMHLLCAFGIFRALGEAQKAELFLNLVEAIVDTAEFLERIYTLDALSDPSMKEYCLASLVKAECQRDAVFHASWAWRRLRVDLLHGVAHDLEKLCVMVFPFETWTAELEKRCPS